jgi:hypothetical protein
VGYDYSMKRPIKTYATRRCNNPERHRSHDGSIWLCDTHMRMLQKGHTVYLIDGRSILWSTEGIAMNLSGGNCEDLWKHVQFVEVTR